MNIGCFTVFVYLVLAWIGLAVGTRILRTILNVRDGWSERKSREERERFSQQCASYQHQLRSLPDGDMASLVIVGRLVALYQHHYKDNLSHAEDSLVSDAVNFRISHPKTAAFILDASSEMILHRHGGVRANVGVVVCPKCKVETPRSGRYCRHCGCLCPG